MAVSEKDVYGEIKKGAKPLHGHVLKHSDRHIFGILDMSLTIPDFPHVWLEVKYGAMPKKAGTMIKVGLTENQKNFIRDEHAAGGKAGWLLCIRVHPRLWYYWCSTDPDIDEVAQDTHHFVRKTGELTNVGRILEIICRDNYKGKFQRHAQHEKSSPDSGGAGDLVGLGDDRPEQTRTPEAVRPVVRRATSQRFGR